MTLWMILYVFLFAIFGGWLGSFLAMYALAPTFPPSLNNYIMTTFVTLAVLSSGSFFLSGLAKLEKLPFTKKKR